MWHRTEAGLIWNGNSDEFNAWKAEWLEKVGCVDFTCRHERMTCGIQTACGDCSSYRYQSKVGCDSICNEVSCVDCINYPDCLKPLKRVGGVSK